MTQHRFAVGVLALCALAGLAGCGGGDDDSDAARRRRRRQDARTTIRAEADVEDDVEATVPEQTSPPTIAEVNILTDFGDVCRGVSLAGATAYDPARTGIHPLITMAGEPPTYEQVGALLPDQWDPAIGEEQTVELVVCLDRTTATLTQTCDGYLDDDGNDSGNTVEMYDASYDVRLVAATDRRGRRLDADGRHRHASARCWSCSTPTTRSRSSTPNPPTSSRRGSSSTSRPEPTGATEALSDTAGVQTGVRTARRDDQARILAFWRSNSSR